MNAFPDLVNVSSYLAFKILHGKELLQYLLNFICRILRRPHYGKLLQSKITFQLMLHLKRYNFSMTT